jgi:hypothetical protein
MDEYDHTIDLCALMSLWGKFLRLLKGASGVLFCPVITILENT